MARIEQESAGGPGSLVESHKGYDPRIVLFYFVIAALLFILAVGLGYQQLHNLGLHSARERQQTQRRILMPGPRGNIYDRNGNVLVTNSPRWTVVLYLDELRSEFEKEQLRIRKNYLKLDENDVPSWSQRRKIALVSVAQRYLDQVNQILHRKEPLQLDSKDLQRHFDSELLLPFTLVDDIDEGDYAKLIERLPVNSPLQVYAKSTRYYPYHSAAAHVLGYVRPETPPQNKEGELWTFPMPGTIGRDGLEKSFEHDLQGTVGSRVYLVDKDGYRITKPLIKLPDPVLPRQGKHITTSLDIDLQVAAEQALGDQTGAAVAIDVATGEVLVMASKPDYDLNQFSPRATTAIVEKMNESGAWNNLALNGLYPPGSTFKILTTIAALRRGAITIDQPIVNCTSQIMVGNRIFRCDVGHGHHGNVLLPDAIAYSCDVYYYVAGERTTAKGIADEARRFQMDQRTGIELPMETGRMIIPDPDWKRRERDASWVPGDTANMAIGQGFVYLTPLHMACFAASVARGETYTKPTLIHQENAPRQHTEPIGLKPAERAALIRGMEGTILVGSGKTLNTPAYRIPGVSIAGKTGTAQVPGRKNVAWFICFAPADNPEIAMAVTVEGDTPGEDFYGGMYAAPVAGEVLKKYFEKKANPAKAIVSPFKARSE